MRRFVDEAKTTVALSHPNIVQILDLGRAKGQYYIAMEFVHDKSLRQISRKCREEGTLIPPWFLLNVVIKVAEGRLIRA